MTSHPFNSKLANPLALVPGIEDLGSEDLRSELDAELAGAYWIYETSSRLLGKSSVPDVLNEILEGAIALTDADFGNIQLLDAGVLRIVTQRHLPPEFLEFFRDVTDDTRSACSTALQCQSRVIVEDVETDELFRDAPSRGVLLRAGVRAVQSTPLIGSSGELYGMLSTLFRSVGCPSARSLRYLDLLAGRAGQVLERLQYSEIERRSERLRASADLANTLAHEINNPVQALANIHSLLSSQTGLPEETQRLLGMAVEQLDRVEETVRRLLAVDLNASVTKSPGLLKLIDHMRQGSGLKQNG